MKPKEFIIWILALIWMTFIIWIIVAIIFWEKVSPMWTIWEKEYCMQYIEMDLQYAKNFCLKYYLK